MSNGLLEIKHSWLEFYTTDEKCSLYPRVETLIQHNTQVHKYE